MVSGHTSPETVNCVEAGQSLWLDYIRRGILTSGTLATMVRDGGCTGVTSNPSIFEKAIGGSTDYEAAVEAIAARGRDRALRGFRRACGRRHPPGPPASSGRSTTVPARRTGTSRLRCHRGSRTTCEETVAEAKRLFALVDRPNVMIKVPGTPAGIDALRSAHRGGRERQRDAALRASSLRSDGRGVHSRPRAAGDRRAAMSPSGERRLVLRLARRYGR